MIKIENIETYGWEAAFRGFRNPKESWSRGDSKEYIYRNAIDSPPFFFDDRENYVIKRVGLDAICFKIGENDIKLARALILAGSDHAKFTRQIGVSMDITAPRYWWAEYDTYKVGTVANSESTMHKLIDTPITREHFSFDENSEDLMYWISAGYEYLTSFDKDIDYIINTCERLRKKYLETQDIRYWRALIQLLPSSWNQKRTVSLNYQVLRNMYLNRKNHKLNEWHDFCDMIDKLPYSSDLISIKKG